VVTGLATSAQAGLEGAASSAADVGGLTREIADSAPETFQTIGSNHESSLAAMTTAVGGGFGQVVEGVDQTYGEMAGGLQRGFEQSALGLEQGLRGSLGAMEKEIPTKADENAAAVPPRWKSVVKWVLIIAVVVLVALVIGPFVIGAVGAALGTGAVMTGIIAGAIVGAATGVTMQVINNWASNRPLGEGVARAALVGAIGGAVGGGFGAYFTSAAQAGTTIINTAFRQFMANTALNVATETVMNVVTTGHFSWEALGMSVLAAVAVGGAMHAAGGLGGVRGIQDSALGAGESLGGTVRTSLGGGPSIGLSPGRPASLPPGEESGTTGATTTRPTEATTESAPDTGTGSRPPSTVIDEPLPGAKATPGEDTGAPPATVADEHGGPPRESTSQIDEEPVTVRTTEPEPDVGLADRGERPAPGERSMTREEWKAEQSRLRAERSVAGVDQPLENPNPNAAQEGHGHGRHGHQTTDAQQADRVRTGIAPDGLPANAPRASGFRSPQAEAEALGRAGNQLETALQSGAVPSYTDPVTGDKVYVNPTTGKPSRKTVVVETSDPRGFGASAQVARRVGGPSSPYVLDANGNRIPDLDATPQMHARIVYEYVPSANEWRPVTYFPEP